MVTKHFWKVLTVFSIMIGLGLLGIFLSSYFDDSDAQSLIWGPQEGAVASTE